MGKAGTSKSVAFLKFKSLLEQETRTFWHVIVSLEYANRWLDENKPPTLTSRAGDNKQPFKSINISTAEFIAEHVRVISHVRENTLVSFVTTFERYIAELLERLVYLEPSTITDSDVAIAAKDLAEAVSTVNVRRWLAAKMADKYLRSKTHAAMISKIDKICKAGVSGSMQAEIEEWSRWSLVRNSIVHTSRQVTPELSQSWPNRFPTAGGAITLDNRELSRIQYLALKIASAIDARAVATILHKRDELLIARELFIQRGIDNTGKLKAALCDIMSARATRAELDKMLADQRRGTRTDDWELTARDLSYIIA